MKRLAILSAIALSGLIYNSANAQIRIRVGLNIAPRPVIYTQAPVVVKQPVYDDSNDDDYYYLPEVNAYYNVNARSYYYYNGDNWITCAYLPGAYRNYDWRSARRYAIHEQRPFMRNDFYRSRYNGREVAEWRHFNNNNRYGGGYTRNNHFDRDAYRKDDNHFGNRGGNYNRGSDNHYGNRGQGGYNNQRNQNNVGHNNGQGRSARPSTQNRDNKGGNEHFAGNSMGMSHRQARF